ncbi:MAG: methyltransferase [Natronospirillum sp.]
MSDFSDVMQRWAQPSVGAHCLLNTDDDDLTVWALAQSNERSVWQCHFRFESHQSCAQQGLSTLTFPALPEERFSAVYWTWPKARAEANMLLDWLPHLLTPTGQVWLIGHNRSGIRSAPKALQALGWTVRKMGSARHCILLCATPPDRCAPFNLDAYWQTATVPDVDGQIWSLPGVFAHGRIDKGSLHLLPWLKDLPSPLVDFGCGAGLLSLVAHHRNSGVNITGVDNNWLAILSSQQTAQRNNLNLTTVWADGLTRLAGRFAGLITNPPFHAGLNTNYDTTHDLLRDSRRLMQPNGLFLAVVNDHLPYAAWLEQYLKTPHCVSHAYGFSVWLARY